MNIILLAPPAAGKGTQADKLAKRFGIVHISTGDLFRERIKISDDFGKKLAKILASGLLVQDEIVLEILTSRITKDDCQNGFILDGFPRTANQAEKLEEILDSLNKKIDYVFYINVEKDVLEKRITGRRLCTKCGKIYNIYHETSKPEKENICDSCHSTLITREDDNIESYNKRYDEYLEKTVPLINYYQKHDILHEIDGNRNIDKVTNEIASIMKRDESND